LYVREVFKKARSIVPEFIVSSTASVANSSIAPNGYPCTLNCTTGTIWVNPLVVATTSNGYKMVESMVLELTSVGAISVISDTTTAKAQAIIWEL